MKKRLLGLGLVVAMVVTLAVTIGSNIKAWNNMTDEDLVKNYLVEERFGEEAEDYKVVAHRGHTKSEDWIRYTVFDGDGNYVCSSGIDRNYAEELLNKY